MNHRLGLVLLVVGCGGDADFDGFDAKDDCDDGDPFVYPGAPDDPADGVDANCDGVDPAHGLAGEWAMERFEAEYTGLQLFVPGTEGGTLNVTEDLVAALDVTADLNPDLFGASVPIDLVMDGDVSPIYGPETYTVFVAGEQYDEQMYVDWTCVIVGDLETDAEATLECEGLLKALDLGLDTTALFRAL